MHNTYMCPSLPVDRYGHCKAYEKQQILEAGNMHAYICACPSLLSNTTIQAYMIQHMGVRVRLSGAVAEASTGD